MTAETAGFPVPDDPALSWRHKILWAMFDFARGRGLEIGPLDNGTVPRHLGDVKYVDVFARDQLMRDYESYPFRDVERIPEMDFTLTQPDGSIQSLRDAAAPGGPYDWVMASHVIEHVPDLIGWLDQVADLVVDGGNLVLAVPDRRYCFDAHRPSTTIGQMLQAHDLGESVPSVRAVYDYMRSRIEVGSVELWQADPPTYEARRFPLDHVLQQVERARAGEYVDSHVWTFTPQTILEQLIELRELDLSSWLVKDLRPTRKNSLEFYLVLERLPRDGKGVSELLADEPRPAIGMPDQLADHAALHRELEATRAQLKVARRRLKNARGLLKHKNERIARLQARTARLQARLAGAPPKAGAARAPAARASFLRKVARKLR